MFNPKTSRATFRFRRLWGAAALMFLLGTALSDRAAAGAACVVAKKMGNSLALEWVADSGLDVEAAVAQAEQKLERAGYGADRYEDLFPQANTELPHAYVIIVKTSYLNARGRVRVSYGCGFSAESYTEAQWAALRDLQSYSWGWTPDKGFEVIERFRF